MAPKGRAQQWSPMWRPTEPKAEPDRPAGKDGGKEGGKGRKGGKGKGDSSSEGYKGGKGKDWSSEGYKGGKGKGDWSNEGYKGGRGKGDWSNEGYKGGREKGDWSNEGHKGGRGGKRSGGKGNANYDEHYSGDGYGHATSYEGNASANATSYEGDANATSYEGDANAGYWGWSAMPVVPVVPQPPPPPLWREYKSDDGTPYYLSSRTGLTQWEKPEELESPSKPAEAGQEKHGASGSRGLSFASGAASSTIRDMDREEQRRARNNQEGFRAERSGTAMRTDTRRRPEGKGTGKKAPNAKEGQGDFGPPGCNLFVFHLPDDWTDEDLHEYFAPHGTIVSAKAMKELGTGRSRGFGFVSYEDRVSASVALKKMQGYKILGKRLKVEFKKGEQEKNDEMMESLGNSAEEDPSSGRQHQDNDADERLIGYLRAISAKNVVQSLKEDAAPRMPDAQGETPDDAEDAEVPQKAAEDSELPDKATEDLAEA